MSKGLKRNCPILDSKGASSICALCGSPERERNGAKTPLGGPFGPETGRSGFVSLRPFTRRIEQEDMEYGYSLERLFLFLLDIILLWSDVEVFIGGQAVLIG